MSKKIISGISSFEDGNSDNKKLLGGKGAGLAKMTQLGLPVPPGFTITTLECTRYYENNQQLSDELIRNTYSAMNILEQKTGSIFGSSKNPLLVSVRSGSAVSMPGMMDTVINVGLNDKTIQGLIEQTGDSRFAYDAYRRFIQLFGKVVLHVDDDKFPKISEEIDMTAGELKELVKKLKDICQKETGTEFPDDPYEQLNSTIAAVFRSWNVKRCVDYRREFNIGPKIANEIGRAHV